MCKEDHKKSIFFRFNHSETLRSGQRAPLSSCASDLQVFRQAHLRCYVVIHCPFCAAMSSCEHCCPHRLFINCSFGSKKDQCARIQILQKRARQHGWDDSNWVHNSASKPDLRIDKWPLNASSVSHSSQIQSLIQSVCGIYVWAYVLCLVGLEIPVIDSRCPRAACWWVSFNSSLTLLMSCI